INARPDVVLVDELAHSNMQGSKHEKRWQDVLELLEAGINVISAVNIQHIESLHQQVLKVTGVDVSERVPDKVLQRADEVVNIDLTAEELINRLKEGKIYGPDKIATALNHFFRPEQILQLRELALKEVASQVERKVAREVPQSLTLRHERFMACISSNEQTARAVIRKTARLSHYYSCKWYVLYVQTDAESADRIGLARQRHLINNFKLATELGAEIIRVSSNSVAKSIAEVAGARGITTVCIGKPHLTLFKIILASNIFQALLNKLSKSDIDLIILS
ncbi:MAG: sensor protein KdpD, partial [Sphingobacteriales bacterium]